MGDRLPIEILGTGTYLPSEVVRNDHFSGYLDTSDDWIVTRTGIRERRKAAPNECTSTMAAEAARAALADAGLTVSEIDMIVCATATGDCQFPSAASFIQGQLGAGAIPAFDVGAACAGFLYGMTIASTMLHSGVCRRALVVGAETLSRFLDPEDRRTAILLGDGAGAVVLSVAESDNRGILYSELGCDGTKTDLILVPAGGSRLTTSATTVAERLHYMRMKGREVYKYAVLKMEELIDRALEQSGVTPDQLRMVIPHQSNLRIIESVQERLKLPREKVAVNIDRFGNTSSASIPMALDEHRRNGTLRAGDIVLLIGIGAGLVWGVMVMRL